MAGTMTVKMLAGYTDGRSPTGRCGRPQAEVQVPFLQQVYFEEFKKAFGARRIPVRLAQFHA